MPCATCTHELDERKHLRPADKGCKVKDMDTPKPTLTKQMRRVTCVHEAGHAVMFALAGVEVRRLAVAPEGDDGTWTFEGSGGSTLADLWGACSHCECSPMIWHMGWSQDECAWKADRNGFETFLRSIASQMAKNGSPWARRQLPAARRIVRGHVCGTIAGPAAEQIFMGDDVRLENPMNFDTPTDDVAFARAASMLLPYRNEYRHACEVTEAALRTPDVWERVVGLANELKRVGDMDGDKITGFLPSALPGWPSSPGSRSRRGAR